MNYCIFDPSGYFDENQISDVLRNIKLIDSEFLLKLKFNSNDVQGNTPFCGYFSMLFLMRMLESDMNFKYSSMVDFSQSENKKLIHKNFPMI
jgi:hypothetical protein